MNILLDNCVPFRARELFPGHAVQHASEVGFETLSNGELLISAQSLFDLVVTTDKKMRHEHDLARLPIPIVELNTHFTRFEDLRTIQPFLESALAQIAKFRFVSVAADGTLERLGERQQA